MNKTHCPDNCLKHIIIFRNKLAFTLKKDGTVNKM